MLRKGSRKLHVRTVERNDSRAVLDTETEATGGYCIRLQGRRGVKLEQG